MASLLIDTVTRRRLALALASFLWFGAIAIGASTGSTAEDRVVQVSPSEPSWALWGNILSNNMAIALLAFAGILTVGLFTVLYAAVSGLLIGHFLAQAVSAADLLTVLRRVGPHAVVELPAIAIAVAAGMIPLASLLQRIFSAESTTRVHPSKCIISMLVDALTLLLVAVLLLVIAALIETWVSPL